MQTNKLLRTCITRLAMDCTLGWPSSSSACCSVNHRTAAAQQAQHDTHPLFLRVHADRQEPHRQHALCCVDARRSQSICGACFGSCVVT